MNVGTLSSQQSKFWITPERRRGYCPYHVWNHDSRCSWGCVQLRADFGDVARATQAYFESRLVPPPAGQAPEHGSMSDSAVRRKKKPPCPACLACGTETRKHVVCSSGPPPPHGRQCLCHGCDGERSERVIDAARIVVADPFTNAALENLYEALRAYDAAPEANAAYWRDNECRIKGIL